MPKVIYHNCGSQPLVFPDTYNFRHLPGDYFEREALDEAHEAWLISIGMLRRLTPAEFRSAKVQLTPAWAMPSADVVRGLLDAGAETIPLTVDEVAAVEATLPPRLGE